MHKSFAPGKVIISGEHSVVYGYPAITMAINLGVTSYIQQVDMPSFSDTFPEDQVLWHAIREVIPEYGYQVSFSSTLPFGKGMGSSAALSVSLIRAFQAISGHSLTNMEELMLAMRMEEHFHGTPSGIDHTTSAMGTGLFFQKGPPQVTKAINIPPMQFLIIDSGTIGNTKSMVSQVRKLFESNSYVIDSIGKCTQQIVSALNTNDTLGLAELMNHNHVLLRKIGLSTPRLETLRDLALEVGALGVKISGSGGGGILLALVENPTPIQTHFDNIGVPTLLVQPYIQEVSQ